jgi:putative oxidoreductase
MLLGDNPMQRIFSTFPNSWPGLGLALLRLATGCYLFVEPSRAGLTTLTDAIVHGVAAVVGALLVLGLWTPVAACAQSALLTYQAVAAGTIDPAHVMRIIVGVSVAMLGPGSFSLDSRLFGRKRIEIALRQEPALPGDDGD